MILTANIGHFDVDHEHQVPVYVYHDSNLPFPLPNLNNRLRGKYVKIMTHRFSASERFIWLDGSVKVTSKRFQKAMYLLMDESGADVVICRHPDRLNVYDEISYILSAIKDGKPYLKERYENEPLAEELAFYLQQGLPKDFPLYACRLFCRANTPKVNAAFDDWWLGCLEYSNFDQTYFSYICWRHGLRVKAVEYSDIFGRYVQTTFHKNDHRLIV